MENDGVRRTATLVLVVLWIVLFVLSLGLRTANSRAAIHDGLPVLSPNDDLYHAKRILHSIDHYPSLLRFDPDRNVTGAWCPWPPLWDFSIASLLRALGFTGIDALAVAIWVAPLLGAIFAATLGVAIAWRMGVPAGLVAGLGVAVPMPLIFVSQLARLDHHVAEGPLMVAIAATVAWIAGDDSGRIRPGRALVLAIALTSALFVQTALLLGCGIAFGALLLLAPCRARLVEGAIGFAVSALAIGAYRLTLPADYPESAWFLGVPHA
ncbi:MAG: hypothetical protein HYU52_15915, partial [Acidobacteria bacterium]|nr:hypothetical protein [Acidobacteriota bacterium]